MESKKVLIISYQYPPCASSGVFRTLRFSKYLPDFNWTPIVLTVAPQYYRNEPLDSSLEKNNRELHAVTVYQTRVLPGGEELTAFIKGKRKSRHLGPPESKNLIVTDAVHGEKHHKTNVWQKWKDAFTLSLMIPDKQNGWLPFGVLKGFQIIRKESPAVLYASGRPWTAFLIGVMLKKMTRLPLVIDFRDPWIDNPYNEYTFKGRERINAFLEKTSVRTADRVIANTEPLRMLFLEKYPDLGDEKFITLTNGYDESEFIGLSPTAPLSNHRAPVSIAHIGTLYSKRNPENFLGAVTALIRKGVISKDNIRIKFIGKVEIPGLKEKVAQTEIASIVEFIDHLPKKEALNASVNSDVLLLIQPATKLQIPAKLFEYIRLGRPILAICGDGATKEIILSNNFGLVAAYEDIEDIEHHLAALYTSLTQKTEDSKPPDVTKQLKMTQFDSRVLTSQLADIFDRLSASKYP